mmetsp:Transcript_621/g.1779  ORF Transcript_621/g.1779 Transcript_621/m.1779 type:complete len:208 (+) Transcript_621:165-788(+)
MARRLFVALAAVLTATRAFQAPPRHGAVVVRRSARVAGGALRAASGDVVMDRDFRLPLATLAVGTLLDQIPYVQILLGLPVTLLGVLFLVQTFRLDFAFDDKAFELKEAGGGDTGENVVVGGANRWTYSSFVNYETFPKGWEVPILVYFKETQTPKDQWSVGPGEQANSADAIANGAVPGQVHFFPAICNAQQITAEFAKRGCKKIP